MRALQINEVQLVLRQYQLDGLLAASATTAASLSARCNTWSSLSPSTMTRITGSVPDARNTTRPESANSPSGTCLTNPHGREVAFAGLLDRFRRARVGDRYVLETLYETGGIIGGETSGHVICLDRTTTGDGLIAALQVLAVMKRTGKTLSKLSEGMAKYPQTMLNVRTEKSLDPSKSSKIQEAISQLAAPVPLEDLSSGRRYSTGRLQSASARHEQGHRLEGAGTGRVERR